MPAPSQNGPKIGPKASFAANLVLQHFSACFFHVFGFFSINFLDAFLLGLLAFFPDFLHFLKTAEVHFGVTSSRILRSGRVSTRERFSKLFAKIRENRYDFYLQNL